MARRIVPALFVASIFAAAGMCVPLLPRPDDAELEAVLGERTAQNLWDVLIESRPEDADRGWEMMARHERIAGQISFEEPSDKLPGATQERVWFGSTGDGYVAGTLVRRGPITVIVRAWKAEDAGNLRRQVRAAAAKIHLRLWLGTAGYWTAGALLAGFLLLRRRRSRSEVPLV